MLAAGAPAGAQPAPDTSEQKPLTWSTDVQVLAGVDLQQATPNSGFNPGNRVAELADRQMLIEIRPDISVAYSRFSFDFGPRVLARPAVSIGNETAQGGTRRPFDNVYVNRWRAKVQFTPALSASYGREVLQWGNSVFRSPSNPFLVDNGRLNPIRELPGQEFAVVSYTPNKAYAVSFISNTRRGHGTPGSEPFRVTNAIKVDYVGESFNAVIIASKKQGSGLRLGGSYTYSASDAVLIYGEMTVAQGSDAYYPQPSSDTAGWRLAPVKQRSGQAFFTNLAGASYTFKSRLVGTVEYLHTNEGYNNTEAGALSSLQRSASDLLGEGGPGAASGAQLLGQALNTGLRVERRNYLFMQALIAEYRNRADLAVSYARNLDAGGGGSFSAYATYSINSRTQFFAVASYNNGPANTEFSRLNRFTLSTGVRLFFSR